MAGKVYLIGAGPGDYKLLTLKALESLKQADVIVYDRLANEDYLKLAKEDCEYIDAGKASSQHTLPQEDINAVIASKALEGKIVARLKGGDPYVFGRGGEEGQYLRERGIAFEVIPGITSAIGGLCYAGIPITHRDYASSFHVITGHLKDKTKDEINWQALAQLKGTLVFLMGVANLEKITKNLIREGKSKDTPVALISWATRYNQSVVTGTLETIYEIALKEDVKPPTLIAIGEVVKLREELNFFEKKKLFGKTVLVTRTRSQSSQLVDGIREQGGRTIEFPMIQIQKIEDNKFLQEAIRSLKKYTYLIFTSQNAIEIFFEQLLKMELDARALAHLQIVAIGNATAKVLRERGIIADIVPEKAVAESLCEILQEKLTKEDYILLPNSSCARPYIKEVLGNLCEVDEIAVYHTLTAREMYDLKSGSVKSAKFKDQDLSREELIKLLEHKQLDYITFTSSSTINYFIEFIGNENKSLLENTKLISIGTITSDAIRSHGLEVHKEAEVPTIASMLESMYES